MIAEKKLNIIKMEQTNLTQEKIENSEEENPTWYGNGIFS